MKTWMLSFKINSSTSCEEMKEDVREAIQASHPDVSLRYQHATEDRFSIFFNNAHMSVLAQGSAPEQCLTVDVHQLDADHPVDGGKVETSLAALKWVVDGNATAYKPLPPFVRNPKVKRLDVAQGGNLIEYDFTEVVFHRKSLFQDVRIMRSAQFGNVLYLDDDLNLGESDIAYTRAICGDGEEKYDGKEVLVLGGGDGGILNYLKDKNANMVTMIDIDGVVIEASRVHLRGICGDAMDQMEGDHHKIIVDDCVKWLERFRKEGRRFDVIINDLTAIPVSTTPRGSHWDFLRNILRLSLDVLARGGRYYTQGNSAQCGEALRMYEEQLALIPTQLVFEKKEVCVPSYQEMWIFYKIWKEENTLQ